MANDINDTRGSMKELHELLAKFDTAMLTTATTQGFRARPMAIHTSKDVPDADVSFFTIEGSAKVAEIEQNAEVGVACFRPGDGSYLSISGRAQITHDREAVKRNWNPMMKLWFPDGPESPEIVVIKLRVESADYWASGGKLRVLFQMAKAAVQGKRADDDLAPVKHI